jgi:hypothetical protein
VSASPSRDATAAAGGPRRSSFLPPNASP